MVEFAGKGRTLSSEAVEHGISLLKIEPAAFWAVMAVETRGFGFLSDRRPLILYERHVFHKQTHGAYSKTHPHISNPVAGGYGAGGANQYARLKDACSLDRVAALNSASWGLGQVMGYNAASAGFADVETMVAKMADDEDAQVAGMVAFIAGHGLAKYLQTQQWAEFALRYNGSGYKKNQYDTKLAKAFNLYSVHPTPNLMVRRCQAALLYLGFNPGGVDGVFGMGSQKALMAWEKARGLPVDGKLSDENIRQLTQEAFPN
ncbi:N-acetylmuramidase domain-containing protein [Rhizobium alvei]|uniref:N-acetylmuramidase domain-containing protein n=1 Tax=Rhizobium alvei TaxID=1132659 RepID=A0ABT8YLP8_9HYPH|nr:N-acetylmuramidase domain-containing protein [Rhizobium alvei]MDO6964162.1 N-acetylmuramidase domain-containing protein [Rhizobium alvei]